ncbi:MAG: hypothetical protein WA045_14950 [Nitrospira sp.]
MHHPGISPDQLATNDTINLGVEPAKTLARVLQCHPAVLVFPGWDVAKPSAI